MAPLDLGIGAGTFVLALPGCVGPHCEVPLTGCRLTTTRRGIVSRAPVVWGAHVVDLCVLPSGPESLAPGGLPFAQEAKDTQLREVKDLRHPAG